MIAKTAIFQPAVTVGEARFLRTSTFYARHGSVLAYASVVATVALLGNRQRPKHWKTARDAEHTVVEVDLGWKRQIVFVVRHGENVSTGGKTHSMVRSKSLRGVR